MAGGKGTRFWPLSREKTPKQLLAIVGERTMIQATVDRTAPLAPPERITVVTGAAHVAQVRAQLPEIPPENIVAEPCGKNTAPCVALAAMMARKRDPDATMAVFPADHVIARPGELRQTVATLVASIERAPDNLGTIGIKPAYPETGYGYIKAGAELDGGVHRVDRFLEKPDGATAAGYVADGSYYWNAGMFFWKAETILRELRACLPELMAAMAPIAGAVDTPSFQETVDRVYPALPPVSIDHGVMETAGSKGKVMVAVADPGWNDVGSWRSLYDLTEPDAEGNRARGRLIAVDATGVVAHNESRVVAAIGVDDVIIIETGDAVLVCHKDKAQQVRQVTEKLRELGLDHLL